MNLLYKRFPIFNNNLSYVTTYMNKLDAIKPSIYTEPRVTLRRKF